MRIYLDCCCLNRPFDDLRQERIKIEAEAVLSILAKVENGDWEIVASEALAVEISETPDSARRKSTFAMLSSAGHMVRLDDAVEAAAVRLVSLGFKQMDGAHLASAIVGKADVFLTVDDALLRRARSCGSRCSCAFASRLAA